MKRYLIVLLMVMLSACGFKLRGTTSFPSWFNNVALIAPQSAFNLENSLSQQLRSEHITVLDSKNKASFWLTLEEELVKDQMTAVSSTTIPRQYQLRLKVRYSLLEARTNKELIPTSTATSKRQLTVNNNQILGSDNEEKLLYEEMKYEAVLLMMNQISHRLARIVQ